jgi:hypothetical protein
MTRTKIDIYVFYVFRNKKSTVLTREVKSVKVTYARGRGVLVLIITFKKWEFL